MVYLHSVPTIRSHGDLRDTCCLIDSRFVLKITGHGMTPFLNPADFQPPTENQVDRNFYNLLWRAPELLRSTPSDFRGTPKGDVYSFGVIVQQIVLKTPPYGIAGSEWDESGLKAKDIVLEVWQYNVLNLYTGHSLRSLFENEKLMCHRSSVALFHRFVRGCHAPSATMWLSICWRPAGMKNRLAGRPLWRFRIFCEAFRASVETMFWTTSSSGWNSTRRPWSNRFVTNDVGVFLDYTRATPIPVVTKFVENPQVKIRKFWVHINDRAINLTPLGRIWRKSNKSMRRWAIFRDRHFCKMKVSAKIVDWNQPINGKDQSLKSKLSLLLAHITQITE